MRYLDIFDQLFERVSLPDEPDADDAFPVPQRMLDPQSPHFRPGLGAYQAGGKYLRMRDKADVTGLTVARASIDVSSGRPVLRISKQTADPATRRAGRLVKTNLIRASAGWTWRQPVPNDAPQTLCSVSARGKHYYALRVEFEGGVTLARYATAQTEPRLRPTTFGLLHFGPEVGSINLRARHHPVFERIIIHGSD